MVIASKSGEIKRKIVSKKWLFFTTFLGITFMGIPIVYFFVDPVFVLIKQYFRLANGTILHNLMMSRVDGPRIYVYLFNFTNAAEYTSGRADKIKLNEVGPFVYQEYRSNVDLVIDPETNLMSYTPHIWTEFIPEESLADPKEMYVTMPSIPMLQGTHMMSKYPFFIRQAFNVLAAGLNSKAIVNITVYDYLWGYPEPLVKFANQAVPGLFYYNSSGLLERLYDVGAKYSLEIGTKDDEKFSVQRVKKFGDKTKNNADDLIENVQQFSNAYEGAAFPPDMTRDMPLYIYRHSVCKIFELQYIGTRRTEYGSEAFTYGITNTTLNDHELCDSKGWCPDGLLNIAPCYFNFPFALSLGHFNGADPRLLERFEGIKPDNKTHYVEMVIDPKLGVTLDSYVSIQLNLALGDLGYNPEARRFKDTVLPLTHYKLKHPKLPWQAITALQAMYIYGPYVLLATRIVCLLLGICLFAYSAKMWIIRKRGGVLPQGGEDVKSQRRSDVLQPMLENNGYAYAPIKKCFEIENQPKE